MQNRRGKGPRRLPFDYDPARARKFARLHRIVRKGLAPPSDKASQRELTDIATYLGKGAKILEQLLPRKSP